jgi:hypothetical protein
MIKVLVTLVSGAGVRLTTAPAPDNTNGREFVHDLALNEAHEYYINGAETLTIAELTREGIALRGSHEQTQPDAQESIPEDGKTDGAPESGDGA